MLIDHYPDELTGDFLDPNEVGPLTIETLSHLDRRGCPIYWDLVQSYRAERDIYGPLTGSVITDSFDDFEDWAELTPSTDNDSDLDLDRSAFDDDETYQFFLDHLRSILGEPDTIYTAYHAESEVQDKG
jgi:hypothetical protein